MYHQRSTRLSKCRFVSIIAAGIFALGGCPGDGGFDDFLRSIEIATGAAPSIREVSPNAGPPEGGSVATIRGRNFEADTGVLFGTKAVSNVRYINESLLEIVVPAGEPGMVDVTVTNGGVAEDTMTGGYAYQTTPAPRPTPVVIDEIIPDVGKALGGEEITIRGSGFEEGMTVMFGGQLGRNTKFIDSTTITSMTPPYPSGLADVSVVLRDRRTATLMDAIRFTGPMKPADQLARVVGAAARDTRAVVVTFSREMSDSALAINSYDISGSESAFLVVTAAEFLNGDRTTVLLTTLTQNADLYTVHVVNVKDVDGDPLAAPDGLLVTPNGPDPSRAMFRGLPPGSVADQIDSDGDGFADWFEMQGWEITVRLVNGATGTAHVTSDPFNPDTDGDGLSDAMENALTLDPRTDDTDADLVPDPDEIELHRSDPADQDTDRDGFSDYLEITGFKTSPILADTDGDQLTDDEEILERNRNPRLSDIPLPQVRIGEMSIDVSETYSFTDETGTETSDSSSYSATFSQADETTYATSSTRSMEATDSFSQGIEAGYGDGSAAGGGFFKVSLGAEQERARGYSYETSTESKQSIQEEFASERASQRSTSERREVSREIESASLSVEVTIVNAGTIAFNVSNLEISARARDAQGRDGFVPLAALEPSSGNNSFNLGPFNSQRGPFVFQNAEIFPNRALDLLRQPRAVLFDVANFDITDELGRNFAFSSEEINDRTAGITIDFGNGEVESYRVATSSTFDPLGRTMGISMREALTDIVGLNEVADDTTSIDPTMPIDLATRDSFGTIAAPATGVQTLTRVRGVQTNLALTTDNRRFWVILSDQDILPTTPFGDIVLKPGATYLLWYVQDNDNDGFFAREEFLAGSSDENPDTDGDGIGDFDEAKVGWEVGIPGNRYRVFSSPAVADTDGDGLDDPSERLLASDPTRRDTDDDGLTDQEEVEGYEIVLFDGDVDPTNNPVIDVVPYSDRAIVEPRSGGDGVVSTAADPSSDDVQAIAVGEMANPGDVIIRPGPDGVLDTMAAGDDVREVGQAIIAERDGTATTMAAGDDEQVVAVGQPVMAGDVIVRAGPDGELQSTPAANEVVRSEHRDLYASDPLMRDTDGDSAFDGREQFLGANPNIRDADSILDSDLDGLTDREEMQGWSVSVNGGAAMTITSDPNRPDTDGDGLPDLLEFTLRSNPRERDSDNDRLSDLAEYDPADPADYYDDDQLMIFEERCALAIGCEFTPAPTPWGTDLLDNDTDDDTRLDGAEALDPWNVTVAGQAAYEVFSDPLAADGDGDTLNDAAELAALTDPNEADTDGDDVLDGAEVTRSITDDNGRTRSSNPLAPDRLILAEYTRAQILDDWDDGDGQNAGEHAWLFQIVVPGDVPRTGASSGGTHYDVSDDNLPNDLPGFTGASGRTNNSVVFVIAVDGSFTFDGEIDEEDPAPNENDVGNFSQSVNVQAASFGLNTVTIDITNNNGDRARVTATYRVYQ